MKRSCHNSEHAVASSLYQLYDHNYVRLQHDLVEFHETRKRRKQASSSSRSNIVQLNELRLEREARDKERRFGIPSSSSTSLTSSSSSSLPSTSSSSSPSIVPSYGRILSTGQAVPPKQKPRGYHKIVVTAQFPGLTHQSKIPGHMTLLFWEDCGIISSAQADRVKDIYDTFHTPTSNIQSNAPKKGQTYLFADSGEEARGARGARGEVDPQGPIGEMIRLFDKSGDIKHRNSCGQRGSSGLHVTAGLIKDSIQFDQNHDLMKRHAKSATWAKNKKGWELPLCLTLTRHLAPLSENVELFNCIRSSQRGRMLTLKWSQAIANHNEPINSLKEVGKVKGIGSQALEEIKPWFTNQRSKESSRSSSSSSSSSRYSSSSKKS